MDQGDYLKYFGFSVLTCQSDSSLQTFIYLKFIYLFLAALGLRCCAQAFSICSERGYSLVEGCRLLSPCWASLVVEQALECLGSVVVVDGFSCPTACGIFPDQGLNPCPLADSSPLYHWGNLPNIFKYHLCTCVCVCTCVRERSYNICEYVTDT